LPGKGFCKISKYIETIKKNLEPLCIILFGSVARGDYNERSDIDLVIISNSFPKNSLKRLKLLMDLIGNLTPIEPFGYTDEEFKNMIEKRHLTALFAMEEGIALYGTKYFKKLRKQYNIMKKRTGLVLEDCIWVTTKLINE